MAGMESYEVTVDIQALTDMYRAQNAKYARKLGILIAVPRAPFAAIGVLVAVMDPEPPYVTVVVVLIAITLLGVALATGRLVTLAGRRPYVNAWFARRSDSDPRGVPTRRLRATYEVRLCELGFEEVSPHGVGTRTAWRELEPDPVRVPEGGLLRPRRPATRCRRRHGSAPRRASRGRRLVDRVEGILLVPREVAPRDRGSSRRSPRT